MASSGIPSAWDDDYESLADAKTSTPTTTTTTSTPTPLPSRAARLAAHQSSNRSLWATASSDTPTTADYQHLASLSLSARSGASAPTTTTAFKPALKVLSRKPTAPSKEVARQDEEDSEEEARKEEMRRRSQRAEEAARERKEKERRYKEVRARLFGGPEGAVGEVDGAEVGGEVGRQRGGMRERGSGGTGSGRRGGRGNGNSRGGSTAPTSASSSAEQSPARGVLYDPGYTPKPGSVFIQRREQNNREQSASPGPNAQHVRQPRGPDGSGRGGSGFAARGRGLGKT